MQHAHQKGVIHRDLKPGNIIVDDSGQPKIVDFGIALAVDPDVKTTPAQGESTELAGTVPYMSYEQLKGDPAEIDTRVDVYALGVIMYHLLSGRLPYDLKHSTIREAIGLIEDRAPIPLGQVVKGIGDDVEVINAKALAKDKALRYQSASDLGGDISRYLASEPILARPPNAMYQLRMFATRNRKLVAGVVAMITTLLASVVVTSIGQYRANLAEADATAIKDFLVEVFSAADPYRIAGPDGLRKDMTVAQALDEGAERIVRGELKGHPGVEAAVRATLGRTYRNLGYRSVADLVLFPLRILITVRLLTSSSSQEQNECRQS